jgi:hypothetical protein
VERPLVESALLPTFLSLAEDEQDSVRLQTVQNAVAFATIIPPQAQVLPVVLATAADRSWRVRWSVASKFDHLCQALGPEITGELRSRDRTMSLRDGDDWRSRGLRNGTMTICCCCGW